jgi:hypothetical protein
LECGSWLPLLLPEACFRFVRVYGYLHHSNGGNDGRQYKTEVVATRIKYLGRKK